MGEPPFLGLPIHQTSINVIMTSTTDTDILRVILPTIAEYIQLSDTLFATLDSVRGRAPKRFRERVDRSKFLHDMTFDGTFTATTRMPSVESFQKLVNLLSPLFPENATRNYYSRKTTIPVEVKIYSALRYMAGGQGLDVHKNMGYSIKSFRRIINQTIDAINNCTELSIELPTGNALKEIHDGFKDSSGDYDIASDSISKPPPFRGCVGAVDGFLALIDKPSPWDGNSEDFFSGHYAHLGLNVQAMCDHECRFTFFKVAAPGKTPDSTAFCGCHELLEWLDGLQTGIYSIFTL